jgi:trk system potassium uptake protein TrkH
VRVFVLIVATAILIITLNIKDGFATVGEALRHAAFTVASLISTTGFSTVDFNLWPELSRTVLMLIMFVGACAGSTGGGIKVSRIVILVKGAARELRMLLHPRQVKKITLDKRPVEHEVVRSVNAYIACYIIIFAVSFILLSFENRDLVTTFSAINATLNNIGPGLGDAGPMSNYSSFTDFSKLVMIFNMLAGRLELFPMLILFSPSTWKKT